MKKQNESKKLLEVLAKAPKLKNIAKVGAKRAQYSIKSKKRIARFIIANDLKPRDIASLYVGITSTSLNSWVKDFKSGCYKFNHAVCISRS